MSLNLDLILSNEAKRECLFHAALILSKKVQVATPKGDKNLRELLLKYNSFENILREDLGILSVEDRLTQIENIGKIIRNIENTDFGIVRISDTAYPEYLKQITQASPVFYYQGDWSLVNNKNIAVIGTRELFEEKHKLEAKEVMERLLKGGYTIVSGLASGSDTLGHKYAVENGGKTIAVLGTTIDKSYPIENKDLQARIAREHLVVSQYPIGIRTFGTFFAHRNINTIALAREGSVIIRSGDKSGTIHGIRATVELGKRLYVLPNNYEPELGATWVNTYASSIIKTEKKKNE